jgi:iron complex outermembrane receptor protein
LTNRPEIPVRPELLDAWELGAKSQFFDNRVRLNAAVFWMDYTDIQIQITDPDTGFRRVANGGAARSKGVELELSAVPVAGFTIDGGVGYQDAKFTENGYVGSVAVTNSKGNRLLNAPRWTANLTSTYELDVSQDWQANASATVAYRSDVLLTTGVESAGATTVNTRVGLDHASGWGFYLWGENLTDVRRITNLSSGKYGLAQGNYLISPPRTYGIGVTAKF